MPLEVAGLLNHMDKMMVVIFAAVVSLLQCKQGALWSKYQVMLVTLTDVPQALQYMLLMHSEELQQVILL